MNAPSSLPALFRRIDTDVWAPSELCRGPWDPRHCHGGPVGALLARAVEHADDPRTTAGDTDLPVGWQIARLTVELTRPVPVGAPLTLTTQVERPGRRVSLVAVVLSDGDTEVARARALRIRTIDVELPADTVQPVADPPGSPIEGRTVRSRWGTDGGVAFHTDACEHRFVEGGWEEAGPVAVWIRITKPVVDGESPTGVQRAVAAADFGNGVSRGLDAERFLFINPDLTVHLVRQPVGEWIGMRTASYYGADGRTTGAGMAESALYDERGRLGRSVQSLFVDPRSAADPIETPEVGEARMSTWELSEEHEAFRKVVRDFADAEIGPHAARWDRDHHFPVDVVTAMGDLGLFGLVFPERWGGSEGDFASLCVAIEELGRVDQSMGITLSAGVGLGANPIHQFGDEQQQDRWLPDLVAGRALGAFGLTEPDGGSDAGATRTRARLDGDEWVIDGSKAFITNCGTSITSIVTVTARTDDGISAFVIPAGTPGMIIEPAYDKLGWHASDTHGITLDGCRVPAENLLGKPGHGFRNFLAILDDGRIAISALALGCARACLDHAVEYAKQRHAFGGPIGRFQGLAFQLSDLAVAVENAHNLTYKAAWLKDQGRPIGQAAAMAKLYSTETAVNATRIATQVFGGAGFIEETPIVRFYRDAKILEIGEGTSEIQRLVLARGLGLPVA